jgi:ribulose-phosphate 3-epimerase
MSVNPGFGGQKFLPGSLDKVRRLRAQIADRGLRVRIEVDGGVDMTNVHALAVAGADIVVAGQAVFGGGNAERDARKLLEAAG